MAHREGKGEMMQQHQPPCLADWEIEWEDRGREPQQPANPDYPEGIDLDLAVAEKPSCRGALPYPAARCGLYMIRCRRCGLTSAITTAGRADDPRSLRLNCKVS